MKCKIKFNEGVEAILPSSIFLDSVYTERDKIRILTELKVASDVKAFELDEVSLSKNLDNYAQLYYKGQYVTIKPGTNVLELLTVTEKSLKEESINSIKESLVGNNVSDLVRYSLNHTNANIRLIKNGASKSSLNDIQLSMDTVSSLSKIDDEAVEQILLHELVHSNTIAILAAATQGNTKAQHLTKDIFNLYDSYKKKEAYISPFDGKVVYSIEEFLANAIADKQFQKHLNKQNIWGRFLNTIKNLLGIQSNTVTEQLLKSYLEVMPENYSYKRYIPSDKYFGFSAKEIEYYTEGVEHDKGGIIADLVSKNNELKNEILDNGFEANHYLRFDKKVSRLSSMFNVLTDKKQFTSKEIAEFNADRYWKYVDNAEVKQIIGEGGEELNKAEYIQHMTDVIDRSKLRGTIGHYVLEKSIAKYHNIKFPEQSDEDYEEHLSKYKSLEPNKSKHNFKWVENVTDSYLSSLDLKQDHTDPILGRKVVTELAVYSPSMNLGTRIDFLSQRNLDGRISLIDHKFGARVISGQFKAIAGKYADELEEYVLDNAAGAAKLELMMRAVMIKESHPEAQFDKLMIGNIQNGTKAAQFEANSNVKVDTYLKFIEKIFKDKELTDKLGYTQKENKETLHSILVAKSPKIFKPTEYYHHKTEAAYNKGEARTQGQNAMQLMDTLRTQIVDEFYRNDKTHQEETARTVETLLKLNSIPEDQWSGDFQDLTSIASRMGNHNEYKLPIARTWARNHLSARVKMEKHYDNVQQKLNRLARKLADESDAVKGFSGFTSIDYTKPDNTGLYDFAYKTEVVDSVKVEKLLTQKNDPKEFNKLTKTQKEFLNLVNQSIAETSQFYNQETYTSTYSDRGKTKTKRITALDLANNNKFINVGASGRKMDEGFFFKLPMSRRERRLSGKSSMVDEVVSRAKVPLTQKLKERLAYTFTKYEDIMFYGEQEGDTNVIPIVGLGSVKIDANQNYTKDLLESTLAGYKNFTRKKYFDDLIIQGEAVIQHLEYAQFKNKKDYTNYIYAIKGVIQRQLIGKIGFSHPSHKPAMFSFKDSYGNRRDIPVSGEKVLQAVARFSIAGIMPFRVLQPLGTFTQAQLVLHRDILTNSLYSKIFGEVNKAQSVYNVGDFARAHGLIRLIGQDKLGDTLRNNKLFRIAAQMRFVPESYTGFVNRSEDNLKHLKAADLSHANIVQHETEDITTFMTLAYQLLALKHTGKDSSGKEVEKSVFDWYDINESGDLVWTGGVRAMVKDEFGVLQEVHGLTERESLAMKATYEQMQGGYSEEVLAPIEATAGGSLLMMLKRWTPRVVANLTKPLHQELLLGAYTQDKVNPEFMSDKDGNKVPIWEWTSRVTEGYMYTFFRSMKGIWNKDYRDHLMWADTLDDHVKRNKIQNTVTLLTMMGSILAWTFGFDDDDKEKTEAVWIQRYLIENLSQSINPWDLVDNIVNFSDFIALKKAFDTADKFSAFIYSLMFMQYTRDGDLKGAKAFMQSLPWVSQIEHTLSMVQESQFNNQ